MNEIRLSKFTPACSLAVKDPHNSIMVIQIPDFQQTVVKFILSYQMKMGPKFEKDLQQGG